MGRVHHGWVIAAGIVVVVGLVVAARVAEPPPSRETITYELTGPREVASVQYGDVFDVVFDPAVMTSLGPTPLPWRVTVPMDGTPTLHHLATTGTDPRAPITCIVRRGTQVVSTQTGIGAAACVTTAASAHLVP